MCLIDAAFAHGGRGYREMRKFLQQAKLRLRPRTDHAASCVDDGRLGLGQDLRGGRDAARIRLHAIERIRSQAESATVAVLLLTQSYLNSDYVCNVELPIFLDRADEGDLEVLPIVVRRGTYDKVKIQRRNKKDGSTSHLLSSFQFVNGPNEPLIDMTLGEQDKVLEKVARHIIRSVAFEAGEGDREQVADEAKQRSDVTAYPNEPQQSPSDVNGTDPSLRELRQEAIKKEEEFGQVSEARYNIVVLGQAGAGKSSLINYLFGKNIRETGTGKPVTLRGFHD